MSLTTSRGAAPIDPLGPLGAPGRYEDELVVVQRWSGAWPRRARGSVRTDHFDVAPLDGRLLVTHRVGRERIDDDLTALLTEELFGPGWVRGAEMFERIFTGIVRSMAVDAMDGWELFYRNTIRHLAELSEDAVRRRGLPGAPAGRGSLDPPWPGPRSSGHGAMSAYSPVYDRACELVAPGTVLELGSCFGFLALRLARGGHPTTASDVSAGTLRLLAAVAPRLGASLTTMLADAARVPADDDSYDTVLAIHLLEHVDHVQGDLVLREALRCARRRVVLAVPLEAEADESYGHVRTIGLDDLHAWGRASHLPYEVTEHHGGWLVIDTSPVPVT